MNGINILYVIPPYILKAIRTPTPHTHHDNDFFVLYYLSMLAIWTPNPHTYTRKTIFGAIERCNPADSLRISAISFRCFCVCCTIIQRANNTFALLCTSKAFRYICINVIGLMQISNANILTLIVTASVWVTFSVSIHII